MRCNQYKKFQMGKISQKEFFAHEKKCVLCRRAHQQDQEIMSAARNLNIPLETGQLWSRLETVLKRESRLNKETIMSRSRIRILPKYVPVLTAATLMLTVFLLGLFLLNGPSAKSRGLLSQQALTRVEKTEKAYKDAIAELERQADSRLARMDLELSFLYRDRLTIIDEQIHQCKEVIEANPANTQVRRFMMAALKDKQETLKEIMTVRMDRNG